MGAADSYFERHAFFGREAAGDLDAQIRKRGEEVLVVAAHRVTPLMMFAPRFIVVPCTAAKGGHDPGQVVRVLSTDVFLQRDTWARMRSLRSGVMITSGAAKSQAP